MKFFSSDSKKFSSCESQSVDWSEIFVFITIENRKQVGNIHKIFFHYQESQVRKTKKKLARNLSSKLKIEILTEFLNQKFQNT